MTGLRLLCICLCFSLTGCLTPRQSSSTSPWRITSAADSAATVEKQVLLHEPPVSSPVYRTFPLTVGLKNRGPRPVHAVSISLELPQQLHVVNPPPGTVREGNHLTFPVLTALGPGKQAGLRLLVRPSETGVFTYAIVLKLNEELKGGWRLVEISGKGQVKITRPDLTLTSRSVQAGDDTFSCDFSVKNKGDAPAYGTLLLWEIPAGCHLAKPFPGTLTGRRLLVNMGTILSGDKSEVSVRFFHSGRLLDPGTVEISATGVSPVRQVVEIDE